MKNKLAGHLPLQDAIAKTLDDARQKMKLAAEAVEEGDKKVKKLVDHEKKEHGHFPSKKEEEAECKEKESSVIDPADPEEVEKLASALEAAAEKLAADSVDKGGESSQGGVVLPTARPVGGTQPYKKDSSKSHNVPNSTGLQKAVDAAGKNIVPEDQKRAPGGTGAKYPAKGVLKTGAAALKEEVAKIAWAATEEGHKLDAKRYAASAASHHEKAKAEDEYAKEAPIKSHLFRGTAGALHRIGSRHADYAAKKHEKGRNAFNPFGGLSGKSRLEKKEKKSSAKVNPVDYILGKIAQSTKKANVELGGESRQGGEVVPNHAPVPSNKGRQLISSNKAPVSATKREAKSPRKKELAEVLTEPAFSAAHDSKLKENLKNTGVAKIGQDLRSATKGGVKTAAARAFLKKVASQGCQCDGAGKCRYCMMSEKVAVMQAARSEASSATA